MKNVVVGLGEILWDMLPEGKQPGGAPANFVYHASQAGCESYMVSAVGKDPLGEELLHEMGAKIEVRYVETSDYPTGTVAVQLDGNGIPQYDICQEVAWDYIRFTPEVEQLAAAAKVVVFGSLAQRSEVSRKTIRSFLSKMPDTSESLKVFDVNLRQSYYSFEVVDESLKLCNVLKINDEEFVVLKSLLSLKNNTFREGCLEMIDRYGLKIVILTCGAECSFIFTKDAISRLDTPKVEVVDTVGAGDSFTAAFCASLVNGKTIREAHETAVKTAAFVCSQKGAMPSYLL